MSMFQENRRAEVNNENLQNRQDEQMDEQQVSFRKIEEMENFGINRADITKLKAGGFNTIESIAHATLKKLQEVKGISEQKAQKLKDVIKANGLVSMGFITAAMRLEIAKDIIFVSTGSRELDNLLGGGIETGFLSKILN